MAKEKKTTATVTEVETTVETKDVEQQIKDLNRSSADVALAAKEEQAKEDEKRRIQKTRRAQARARYTNLYILISRKRKKKEEDVEKEILKKSKEILDNTENGKLTFNESEKAQNDLFDERRKKYEEIDAWSNEMKRELDTSFSNSYDIYDIDWRMDRGRGRQLW